MELRTCPSLGSLKERNFFFQENTRILNAFRIIEDGWGWTDLANRCWENLFLGKQTNNLGYSGSSSHLSSSLYFCPILSFTQKLCGNRRKPLGKMLCPLAKHKDLQDSLDPEVQLGRRGLWLSPPLGTCLPVSALLLYTGCSGSCL